MRHLYVLFLTCLSLNSFAATREIAITIDDLPLVASRMDTPGNQKRSIERFSQIVNALVENQVPATGFVIAGAIAKGQWAFLEQFQNAGFTIGNHTYSHYNLNQVGADKDIADIDRADKILTPLYKGQKYFRYPYLAEGNSHSKPQVLKYLSDHHYKVAPVTIDSKDFRFNASLYKVPFSRRINYIYQLKPKYLAYIWNQTLAAERRANGEPQRQILLIHANLLNSYLLADIIKMYKDNGYRFITLEEALKNPAPSLTIPVRDVKTVEPAVESALPTQ